MPARIFATDVEVRSYEVDYGGVVNNAVWINYLEHARMDIFRQLRLDVVDWVSKGVLVVVRRLEVDYLRTAGLGDRFRLESWVETVGRSSVRVGQRAFRDDGVALLQARVVGVFVGRDRRPVPVPEALRAAFPPEAIGEPA